MRLTPYFTLHNPQRRLVSSITLVMLAVLIAAPLLVGCLSPTPASTALPAASLPPPDTPVPSAALEVEPATPTMLPSPAQQPALCPVEASTAPSFVHGPFAALPEEILDFLNAGAGPQGLRQALEQAFIASQPLSVLEADLTGDGWLDLAVSIFDPTSSLFPPASMLLLVTCEQDRYQQALAERRENGAHLWFFQDLNADGRAELVVSWASCGAHTCFDEVQILGWDGSRVSSLLDGSTADLAYPLVELSGPDAEGMYGLRITASGPGSVGAGPPRSSIWLWLYNPATARWLPAGGTPQPSEFRIHVLHDAEAAAGAGLLEQALADYRRVVLDDGLQEWIDPGAERASLSAYARFRQVVVFWRLDQPGRAEQVYQELAQSVQPGGAQQPYAEMADAFLQQARLGGLETGCRAVESYAQAYTEQVLLPLNAYGYANRGFTAADLCP